MPRIRLCSELAEYFNLGTDESDGTVITICRRCDVTFAYNGSTSSLLYHLSRRYRARTHNSA